MQQKPKKFLWIYTNFKSIRFALSTEGKSPKILIILYIFLLEQKWKYYNAQQRSAERITDIFILAGSSSIIHLDRIMYHKMCVYWRRQLNEIMRLKRFLQMFQTFSTVLIVLRLKQTDFS